MKHIITVLSLLVLTACSNMQVAELDPVTGRFPSKQIATVNQSKTVDLDSKKALLLLPDSEFFEGQVANIGYFDETLTVEELETAIIKNNLTDKVPTVRDKIGINKAAKEYKPFLWLRLDVDERGTNSFVQLKLTDPVTLDDLFVAERYLDFVWAGVNDQQTWYPLFNALVDYIDDNSATWNKSAPKIAKAQAKSSLTALYPSEKSQEIATEYPQLVEKLYSRNSNVVQQAAKKIGEENLISDAGLLYASKSVLENALINNNVSKEDKYLVDALAWCAINIGRSKDRTGRVLLSDVASSDLPRKVRNHAIDALKSN